MRIRNDEDPPREQPQTPEEPGPRWEFGNLLDEEAQGEIREFYAALESSKECKTVLVGYTPPRD